MNSKYVIGLDFGTNSCRSLIIKVDDGVESASHVFPYPSGRDGVIIDLNNPNLARQNPADYVLGIEVTIKEAVKKAKQNDPDFNCENIIGIAVDTTGSSPMPVDINGEALCSIAGLKDNPAAMCWLWKDHTSFEEAAFITKTAAEMRPQYLAKIGGVYSSEWFWSKILNLKKTSPQVYNAVFSFVEICDWITAVLTGELNPLKIKRSICAAGHKAMFSYEWGGLPDEEFLNALSPGLGDLRKRLYNDAYSAEKKAGNLSQDWSGKLGLSKDVIISVGAFDAHMGAVGAGIQTGTLVKIIGTSTCDIMVSPIQQKLEDIPGVCGIVNGSVMEGFFGIEAGQSGVGDIFLWFVNNFVPESYGKTPDEKFKNLEEKAALSKPGESGLMALDWNNGNRTILVDVRLTGLLLGQTLHTEPHEIYRALMEATAYGALAIIERIEEYGVKVEEVINCGGLAVKSPLLMQIYADITGRPMKISGSEQTPALGAGIFAAVAAGKSAGGYSSIDEAKNAMTSISKVYQPVRENVEVYKHLYKLYRQLHDGFGTGSWTGKMSNVMKDLLNIRDEVRRKNV
ncbi:MAG: ribulokinase [Oscillospiraceae bacterium]|jgi:L-ribulokinase